jgi:hypothetical protein
MFSEESIVSMGDGSFKKISELRPFDFIYNKFKNPVKINTIQKILQQSVLKIEINNTFFYTTPDTLFLCVYHTEQGFVSKYLDIVSIQNLNGKLKNSIKIFSNETDNEIINVTNNYIKDVYKLTTLDSETSYFVNGVITKCDF